MCNNNYISAGLYIGYNYYVKYILHKFINSDYEDDQEYFTSICNNDNNIGIDTNILFYNYQYNINNNHQYKNNRLIISNNKTYTMPIIISAPGNVDLTKILTHFNYNIKYKQISLLSYIYRNKQNLFNLFKVELLFLILLLFCIYKILL